MPRFGFTGRTGAWPQALLMLFSHLNALSGPEALAIFRSCCGSSRWAAEMTGRLPFATMEEMLAAADDICGSLGPSDWLEAFASHPRIGDVLTADRTAAGEQSGVAAADAAIRSRLAQGNRDYEARFGYIFIISAQGKSAGEMLESLERRLKHSPDEELPIAAAEQAKIMRLRLNRLLT